MRQVASRKNRVHLINLNMNNFTAVVITLWNGATLQKNRRQKNDISLFSFLGRKRKLIGKITLINLGEI